MKPLALASVVVAAVAMGAGTTYALTDRHGQQAVHATTSRSTHPLPAVTPPPSTEATSTTTEAIAPPTSSFPAVTAALSVLLPPVPSPLPTTSTTAPLVCPQGAVRWTVLGFKATPDQYVASAWRIEEWGTITDDADAGVIVDDAQAAVTYSPPPDNHSEASPMTYELAPLSGVFLAPGQSEQFDGGTSLFSTSPPSPTGLIAKYDTWQEGRAIKQCPSPR